MKAQLTACVMTLLALAGVGCVEDRQPAAFAKRAFRQFEGEVWPVLLRDCGFPTCHGDPDRFFQVWGPGRLRVQAKDIQGNLLVDAEGKPVLWGPFDTPDIEEKTRTMNSALAMIDDRDPKSSLLLRKPLAVEAGGAGHRGVDPYGRDVYRTTQDSGYVSLARWVLSASPAMEAP